MKAAELNLIDSAKCFTELFLKLKAKIHEDGVTYDEKIQILTFMPDRWSNKTIADKMDVTVYMVKLARRLAQKYRLLSIRTYKKSGKYIKHFLNLSVKYLTQCNTYGHFQ